jgi:hypothetical protein
MVLGTRLMQSKVFAILKMSLLNRPTKFYGFFQNWERSFNKYSNAAHFSSQVLNNFEKIPKKVKESIAKGT